MILTLIANETVQLIRLLRYTASDEQKPKIQLYLLNDAGQSCEQRAKSGDNPIIKPPTVSVGGFRYPREDEV